MARIHDPGPRTRPRLPVLPLVLSLTLVPAACVTADRQVPTRSTEAETLLQAAEDALAHGRVARAEDALRAARHVDPAPSASDLAMVEAAIQTERGQLDQARRTIAPYADTRGGRELLGRIALREGSFEEAHAAFRALAPAATDAASAQRLEDLAALARGFAFYSEGRYGDAIESWSTIRDDATYDSLSRALADAQNRRDAPNRRDAMPGGTP